MGARIEVLILELTAAIREEVGALPSNVLTLGEEVKLARTRSRMSLQDVADASGFTKSHVWEIEQGRALNPTVALIAGLSRGLGVPFLRLAQAALNSTYPAESRVGVRALREQGNPATDEHRVPTPPLSAHLDAERLVEGRGEGSSRTDLSAHVADATATGGPCKSEGQG
jgi:transcriptional regulator with XRE-family HTH domain